MDKRDSMQCVGIMLFSMENSIEALLFTMWSKSNESGKGALIILSHTSNWTDY